MYILRLGLDVLDEIYKESDGKADFAKIGRIMMCDGAHAKHQIDEYIEDNVFSLMNQYLADHPLKSMDDKINVLATERLIKFAKKIFKEIDNINSISLKAASISHNEELEQSISFGRSGTYAKVTVPNTLLDEWEALTDYNYDFNLDKLPMTITKDIINDQFKFTLDQISDTFRYFEDLFSSDMLDGLNREGINFVASKMVKEYIFKFNLIDHLSSKEIMEGPVLLNEDLSINNYLKIGDGSITATISFGGRGEAAMKDILKSCEEANYFNTKILNTKLTSTKDMEEEKISVNVRKVRQGIENVLVKTNRNVHSKIAIHASHSMYKTVLEATKPYDIFVMYTLNEGVQNEDKVEIIYDFTLIKEMPEFAFMSVFERKDKKDLLGSYKTELVNFK